MAEEAPSAEQDQIDPLKLFPEEVTHAVEGLMYLGQLQDTVEFCGHTFELRTLMPQHKFAISVVLQPYRNTIHEIDVYQALHVGMALTSVDNNTEFCPPIGPDLESFSKARLNYIATNWYPPTVEFLWSQYVVLEATAARGIRELDSLSKGGQPTKLPSWLDSLTVPEPSPDETNSDTPPSTPSS